MLTMNSLHSSSKNIMLLKAASMGDITKVAELLKYSDTNINTQGTIFRNTALHMASAHDKHGVVELLLTHDANADIQNADGMTPLHVVVERGNKVIVSMLLNKNANLNISTMPTVNPVRAYEVLYEYYGKTPLFLALQRNHIEIIKLLINKGAHPYLRDLQLAVESHNPSLVEFILNKLDIEEYNNCHKYALGYPLEFAAKKGLTEIVALLIKKEPESETMINSSTALEHAALGGHIDTVKLLLECGAQDINNSVVRILEANIDSGEQRVAASSSYQQDRTEYIGNHTDSYLARIYLERDVLEDKYYYSNIPWAGECSINCVKLKKDVSR